MYKLTEYIEKAKNVHNNKYDYSLLTGDILSTQKIKIICPIHGMFIQQANKHLMGQGCPKCAKNSKKDFSFFIDKCIKIHGDKYSYNNFKFVNMSTKGEIFCKKHNIIFFQTPEKHLMGQGCPICKKEKISNRNKNENNKFIEKAKETHNDFYDYSKTVYKNTKEKVCITCPKHGDFWQLPSNHLRGQGCPLCARETVINCNKSNTLDFIKKSRLIHGNKYDYSKTYYESSNTKVCITCPKHGDFWQTPSNHLQGQGCPICKESKLELFVRDNLNKNNIKFIPQYHFSKILPKRYSVDFFIPDKNIAIECQGKQHFIPDSWGKKNKDNEFNSLIKRDETKYRSLIENNIKVLYYSNIKIKYPYFVIEDINELINFIKSTPNRKYSYIEKYYINKLYNNINKLYGGYIKLYNNNIFIPEFNLIIKVIDINHHNELNDADVILLYNLEKCMRHSMKLLQFYSDELEYRFDIIMSILKNKIHRVESKIYARKCEVKEITDSKIASEFLDQNHIQGKCGSSIKLGLYHNNELVSLMTFGKSRHFVGSHNISKYELLRFCNKLNTVVIGGASKLFNYFIKKYNPESIVSYADRRWSQGNLYEKLGFELYNESKPNYYYIINDVRKNRFNFRKSILIKNGFDKNKSEHEIMLNRGIYRIYDCGCLCYLWKKI